jgi:protein O-GlcNAc transferase
MGRAARADVRGRHFCRARRGQSVARGGAARTRDPFCCRLRGHGTATRARAGTFAGTSFSATGSLRMFDIAQYTRAYEAALTQMWETWANGHETQGVAVPAAPPSRTLAAAEPSIKRRAYSACLLCESRDMSAVIGADCSRHPIYQPGLPSVMNWHLCGNCGHVFTEGYFDAGAAALVFAKTQPGQTVGYDMERQRPVSARIIERVARHVREGRWLDVGFGNGSLLFTAEEWGYTPVGLDLRKDNVRALKGLGYEAYCQPIEELDHEAR